MDPGHKARKNLSDNADLGFQAVGPTLHIMQLNVEGLSAAALNRQPYEGRLPLTSWWRKSSNMTVGQCSLIYLAHHCYD